MEGKRRYYIRLLVRSDAYLGGEESLDSAEKEVLFNHTCNTEMEARRAALERAYSNGCLVSRFLEIRSRRMV